MSSPVLSIPQAVRRLLLRLNAAGFEAYAVGGCVRDTLCSRQPSDWDLCTAATPQQIAACFCGERTILTGAKYGTVTVLLDAAAYEITTFRAEAGYSDTRHPDAVTFLRELRADLARRDFTINAMAADASGALIDPFGGAADLRAGIVRCVGEARARFSEDALRLMRALRFAAQLDFTLAPETAQALHESRRLLRQVAAERLSKELRGLLCGTAAARVAREFADVLCVIMPELAPCIGFCQWSFHHRYDVWEHTLRAVQAVAPQPILRLAALLHDIGKPRCFTFDKNLRGHFYGHAPLSAAMGEQCLRRLRFDGETIRQVRELVAAHGFSLLPLTERHMKRLLGQYGEPTLRLLLQLRRADLLAKGVGEPERLRQTLDEAEALLEQVLARAECFSLAQLAVSGADLLRLGVPQGRRIGALLQALLRAVIDAQVPNTRQSLVEYAQSLLDSKVFD